MEALEEKLKQCQAEEPTNDDVGTKYMELITGTSPDDDPQFTFRERAIYQYADYCVKKGSGSAIFDLSNGLRDLFHELSKAKTAKIVRTLIDKLSQIPGSGEMQIKMCQETIDWCVKEKHTFLRQRVQTRLASMYLATSQYQNILELLPPLLRDVKKLDDKLLLVEIYLLECRTQYSLTNIPKAKASLTAAKTNANAIHCPPLLQADIDLWSGILTAREKDHRTSFSYFYEAFEAYNTSDKKEEAMRAMTYMVLSKIMSNRPGDVSTLLAGKNALKYDGKEMKAMRAVASAHDKRSLEKFEEVTKTYKDELVNDPIISYHLGDLNETLLEQNVLKILEPFSRVEIDHVAELIKLPLQRTQGKLREMILDKKLNGTLDQGHGVLIVYDQEVVPSTYDNSLLTIKATSEVLQTLSDIAKAT